MMVEAGPADKITVPNMDHFWFNAEIPLADQIEKWIVKKIVNLGNKEETD